MAFTFFNPVTNPEGYGLLLSSQRGGLWESEKLRKLPTDKPELYLGSGPKDIIILAMQGYYNSHIISSHNPLDIVCVLYILFASLSISHSLIQLLW